MYFVYILCDERRGRLYTGLTNDIMRRQWEHATGYHSGYAHLRGIFWLVHLELFGSHKRAVAREKEIKKLNRKAKIHLIERNNPGWQVYRFTTTRHKQPDDTAPRFYGG